MSTSCGVFHRSCVTNWRDNFDLLHTLGTLRISPSTVPRAGNNDGYITQDELARGLGLDEAHAAEVRR